MKQKPKYPDIRVLPDTPQQIAQSFGTQAKVDKAFRDRIAYLKRKK